MHYYKRNLGDYAKKAGRLTMLQHGAFNLLIDACYDREAFPTLEEAIDWTWACSPEEVQAVEFVLRKFFELEGDRYVQKRIEKELNAYREKQDKNQQIARYREYCKTQKRRKCDALDFDEWAQIDNETCEKRNETCTKRARDVEKTQPNHKPLTTNQYSQRESALSGFEEFYAEYPRKKDREKAKKAWVKNRCAEKTALIIDDVRKRKRQDRDWLEGYAPYPATYLNGSRWNDDIEATNHEQSKSTGGGRVYRHPAAQGSDIIGRNDTSW